MFDVISTLNRSIIITLFVFVMMLLVDYFNVLTEGRLRRAVRGDRFRQYTVASFLGATPGCLGAFMNVSLYVHGLLTFGAILGGMIATSGDEAFVMLTMFPREALILFILLFILGIIGAWIADKIAGLFHLNVCEECRLQVLHDVDRKKPFQPSIIYKFPRFTFARYILILIFIGIIILDLLGLWGPQSWSLEEPDRIIFFTLSMIALFIILTSSKHYLREHIVAHLIKKHIWRVFLWTFFALLFVGIGLQYFNLEGFVTSNIGLILIISAIVGLIPESGPHLIFVTMFANGIIPFSVLLTSSIVQDGHGMLPLFSYTIRDSILIKLFNLFFGLIIGGIFLLMGL
ncbi:MAG: selenocysteine protein [Thermoplasmata archaeon]|nr:MAG: selenocysteine protein [Thermoplasmata archaeon]